MRPNQLMRASKNKPNRHKMIDPWHKSRSKATHKTTRSGSRRTGWTEATTSWPWWLPWLWQLIFPPGLLGFRRGSCVSKAIFFSLCCYFALKRMNLAKTGARFHSFSNPLTHLNSIGEIGRRRKRIKRKQLCGGKNQKIVNRTFEKEFLNYLYFQFSLVRFSLGWLVC